MQQFLGILDVDKAARDDLRLGQKVAVLRGDRQHDDDHAVLGEMLAVAQHDRADVADAVAVDKHLARGRITGHALHRARADLDGVAVVANHNILAVHAHLESEILVQLEHALLAVHGDEILGLCQRVDDLELLLARMARNVQHVRAVVDDLNALAEELVDDTRDGVLVAGDGARRDDDAVAGADLDLLVLGKCHAVQGGHLLALRAGGDDDLLFQRHRLDLVDVDHGVFRRLHVAEVHGDFCHVFHAAARDGDLAPALRRGVHDLLNAVDVGGERRDDDALLAALEQAVEGPAHRALTHRVARALDVRRIREQRQNALLAKLAKAGKVDDLAVDGRRVDLEVARVDNGAKSCVDGKRDRVRDGVVHVDELHAELAGLDGHAAFHRDDLRRFEKAVLFEL